MTRLEIMLLDCRKHNLMQTVFKVSPAAYVVNQILQRRKTGEVK